MTKRKTKTTKNVVPAKYRERYEDGSCGDTLAVRLKKHVTADDGTTDVARLRARSPSATTSGQARTSSSTRECSA
jgi:hypothetical protein